MTRATLKRFVFVLLFVAIATMGHAQVLSARVGINGLTCSQCSRSVEMQLRKLPFVKTVDMDLEKTEGSLQFKEGANVDFSKIAQAVKDAGFSVRFLKAEIDLNKVEMKANSFTINKETYLIEGKVPPANSKNLFIFKGKKYSSEKDASTNIAPGKNRYRISLAS
jgi:copper chaperone CopZ